MDKKIPFRFKDADGNECLDVTGNVVIGDYGISIQVNGYGDHFSTKTQGTPILIESLNGALRVVIWGDINQEDPIKIDLAGAREDKRRDDKMPREVTRR